MSRFCTQCGHRLADDDRFCSECGTPVKSPVSENTETAVPSAGNKDAAVGETRKYLWSGRPDEDDPACTGRALAPEEKQQ